MFIFLRKNHDLAGFSEIKKRSILLLMLMIALVFLLMNPGKSIIPGGGPAPQSPAQAAVEDAIEPVLEVESAAPEIGPVSVFPDVMNDDFCTAVAQVKNPRSDLSMRGADGIFTITGSKGAIETGRVYVDRLEPGESVYVICNYIPAPGGHAAGATLALYPKGWEPGRESSSPGVTGGRIDMERASRQSGYSGWLLFASGRVENPTGSNLETVRITVIGIDIANQPILAESFYLYDVAKDSGQNFRYQLSGIYQTAPQFAQTVLEAKAVRR